MVGKSNTMIEKSKFYRSRLIISYCISSILWQPANEDDEDNDDDGDDDNNSSNMIVDAPEAAPQPHLNPADMPVEEPRTSNPKAAEAAVDGWVVVSSKRNRGKRN